MSAVLFFEVPKMPVKLCTLNHYIKQKIIFLIIAILTGMRWYVIVILIRIYLVTGDVSTYSRSCWPFVCLLWRNVYSRVRPVYYVNWLFTCLLFAMSYMSSLYILDINSLSDTWVANMFSHSVSSFFVLLTFSCAEAF